MPIFDPLAVRAWSADELDAVQALLRIDKAADEWRELVQQKAPLSRLVRAMHAQLLKSLAIKRRREPAAHSRPDVQERMAELLDAMEAAGIEAKKARRIVADWYGVTHADGERVVRDAAAAARKRRQSE